ncbi:MAG: hypothetical protein PHH16_04850 [Candidatus Gracilibacteria bacterium]|nr:hypothetical protein [Candidatus Gracilibacteria bacterium]
MKELSKKITISLIGAIFFLVPLFFSHILKVLSFPIIFGNSSYERIKVELFYGLLIALIPFWIRSPFFKKSRAFFENKRNIFGIIALLIILCISAVLAPDLQTALLGGGEKQHGILLFIALGIFFLVLATLPEIYRISFIKISFVSLAFVLFYATMQWMGLDQLGSRYILSFSEGRVFSTLGNPNYLAGFFILFLPLVQKALKTRAMRNLWYGLLLFGVAISGSLFGISIVLGYFIFRLFSHYGKRRLYIPIIATTICILGISIVSPIVPREKLGSAEHHMIIWETGIRAVFASPERMLFGYGPEQFRTIFPRFVAKEDARYFQDNTPDRAHDIFLDILFSFGIVGLVSFLALLLVFFRNRTISAPSSQVMMLFLLFFSFNIPVLVHFLIAFLVVSLKD